MRSALNHARLARKNPRQVVNRSSPKAEVTGSNPVGCASRLMKLPRNRVLFKSPKLRRKQTRKGDDAMRKLMMVAAAAAIALVGLSANTCGGGEQKPAEQPAAQPETQPETPPATPPAPPAQ